MKKAALFIPCLVNHMLPHIGSSTRRLLERLGVTTTYSREQTCCGQMVYNKGHHDEARGFARHFIEVFEGAESIVAPSGSCVCMVKSYPELFEGDRKWRKRAEDVASKVFELTQYIVDELGVTEVGARFDGKVAYHECCHVNRGLGVSLQPKSLITATQGCELVHMNGADQCCGFGGEFAMDFSDISGALVETKVKNYMDSGADLLVLNEPGCLLNISGYLSRNHHEKKAVHIADFLMGEIPEIKGQSEEEVSHAE